MTHDSTAAREAIPVLRSPPFPGIDPAVAAVARPGPAVAFDAERSAAVVRALREARVGGCFWGRQAAGARVLVAARSLGDLDAAGRGGDDVLGVVEGREAFALERAARRRGLRCADASTDPWSLVAGAEMVVGDAASELALLWRMTRPEAETDDATLALVHRRLIDGVAYRDPQDGATSDVLAAIACLGAWRRLIDDNRARGAATGISWWKTREIARLLWDGVGVPSLRPAAALARSAAMGRAVAAWPSRVPPRFWAVAAQRGVAVHRIEDGFLRSPGLGSDLHPPLSVVVDRRGLYYDPAAPSDLEHILSTYRFMPALVARAAALRARIVAERLGKYGHSGSGGLTGLPHGRRIVLVAGQVGDDQSVLQGGAGIDGNMGLLERARAAEPDAYVIFRPHPDVEAGHRAGAIDDTVALRWADRVARGGSLVDLLAQVDALHVLSSLTGFEALLRGLSVTVHGQPFYAGWGLTTDLAPAMLRRSRKLELDEMVAAALILYPRYLNPANGLPCGPEAFLDGIGRMPARTGMLIRLRRLQGRLRRAMRAGYVAP